MPPPDFTNSGSVVASANIESPDRAVKKLDKHILWSLSSSAPQTIELFHEDMWQKQPFTLKGTLAQSKNVRFWLSPSKNGDKSGIHNQGNCHFPGTNTHLDYHMCDIQQIETYR